MEKELLLQKFEEFELKSSTYRLALSALSFDRETIAPKKGASYRNTRIGILSGEFFAYTTSPENIQLLVDLDTIKEELPFEIQRNVEYRLKDLEALRYIPKEKFVENRQTIAEAGTVWEKARKENNYDLFKPYLIKLIEQAKELASYRPTDLHPYDLALDDYETGMTMEKYDQFFSLVKEKLVSLIHKVNAAKKVDDSFLHLNYDVEKQKEFMKQMMTYIDYDLDAGYLSESAHPFSMGFSVNDNRITTRYLDNMISSSILSIIHELGHATYNGQVNPKFDGTFLANNMTSGMHESQSRLFENYLGRSKEFWIPNYDKLQSLFPEQLGTISIDQFVDAINASYPSYIRTEADELTYPLHVLIRYEIEKGLFNNELDLEKLDQIWDDKYEQYLGIRPRNHAEGILQDVHWSSSYFGYFPTYALGSAYSAQWMKAMRKDINIEEVLKNNQFSVIKEWLKENIHQYGGLYTPEEMLIKVTGEPFNPQYYIDYLMEKYTKLYDLD